MRVGKVEVAFLGHSGFMISNGMRVVIDPYNVSDKVDKADLVLVTHSHYDHCSIKDLEKVCKSGTIVVMPADCQSKVNKIRGIEMQVVESGDKVEVGGVKIEAVPAYNLNKDYHPKSEGWLGYVVKMENVIVYHAGDTDKIPEMQKLTGYGKHGNEFVVLLPVSGKFVMNSEQAADVASLLSPHLAIPMHYGAGVAGTEEDARHFAELCEEKNIKTEVLESLK